MTIDPNELMQSIEDILKTMQCNLISDIGTSSVFSLKNVLVDPPSRYLCPLRYACCGIGIPLAIGAGIDSDCATIALVGDAAARSRLGSLHSAAELGLSHWCVVIVNNGSNLMCEQGLGAEFPDTPDIEVGRFRAPIDFAQVASGLGLVGVPIDRAEDVGAALREAMSSDRPWLLDCKVDASVQADIRQRVLQLMRQSEKARSSPGGPRDDH